MFGWGGGGGSRRRRRYWDRSGVHEIAAIRQSVNFGECDTSPTFIAAYDHRVSAGIKRNKNRGFEVVGRRDTSGDDFGLLRVPPVVICCDKSRAASIQLELESEKEKEKEKVSGKEQGS